MSDTRRLKYGIGSCPVCGRRHLALAKNGRLRTHSEGVPWSKRKCPNRQAHPTPLAVDCAYCHCSTAVIHDGVCINCVKPYKSHSH